MVRFFFSMDLRQHVGLMDLRRLSWLSVPDRVAYFKLLHLFRVCHGIAPRYLMTNFKAVSEAHSHNTRSSSHNFFISRDLSLSPNSFTYTAIKVWNSLPLSLKSIDKIDRFKRSLKDYFFEGYIEWRYVYITCLTNLRLWLKFFDLRIHGFSLMFLFFFLLNNSSF